MIVTNGSSAKMHSSVYILFFTYSADMNISELIVISGLLKSD